MGHIQQFEADFRARLQAGDVEELVKWVKEQVLKSYRNGLVGRKQPAGQEKAAKRGTSQPRNEDSAR